MDKKVIADKYYLVFQGRAIGGFTTAFDGNIGGLFSPTPGNGRKIAELQIQYALQDLTYGNVLRIMCIGDRLKKFHESNGWTFCSAYPWDPELAPEHWITDDTPNVYVLRWYK